MLIKGTLNPLPTPATLHFRVTLSSRQRCSCCLRLLLLKANRTRTGPFMLRLHVFAGATDVTPQRVMSLFL